MCKPLCECVCVCVYRNHSIAPTYSACTTPPPPPIPSPTPPGHFTKCIYADSCPWVYLYESGAYDPIRGSLTTCNTTPFERRPIERSIIYHKLSWSILYTENIYCTFKPRSRSSCFGGIYSIEVARCAIGWTWLAATAKWCKMRLKRGCAQRNANLMCWRGLVAFHVNACSLDSSSICW